MPSLQVREVPAYVYDALVDGARKEHRSLAQQALVTLERGLGIEEDRKQRRRRILDSVSQCNIEQAEELPDPVTLVREDRER